MLRLTIVSFNSLLLLPYTANIGAPRLVDFQFFIVITDCKQHCSTRFHYRYFQFFIVITIFLFLPRLMGLLSFQFFIVITEIASLIMSGICAKSFNSLLLLQLNCPVENCLIYFISFNSLLLLRLLQRICR